MIESLGRVRECCAVLLTMEVMIYHSERSPALFLLRYSNLSNKGETITKIT